MAYWIIAVITTNQKYISMKRIFVLVFVLLSIGVFSQEVKTAKKINMQFSGFVRNDFIIDTRRNVDACDHLLELYPKKPVYDSNGEDINAQASATFLNIFTRFGTRFSGLELGGAKVGAYVEFDFTGGSGKTNSLRFRHAYTQFAWEKTKLLFGRTWHPTFIEKVFPSTLNENTGLPFQVFNRSPQLRVTHQLNSNLDLIAAAVYQVKYMNFGPNGKSYQYQQDALIPNLHLQLQYYDANWVVGAAFDWKSIQPRTSTTGTGGTFVTSEKLNTVAALVYLKYTKDKFQFKAKTMYGQNVSESLFPGGYAVVSIDSRTGAETYTPTNHIYNFVNFTYGTKWRVGLFAGYLKNLGTSENPLATSLFYARSADMDACFRVSPQLIYTHKNFMFGWEMSLTTATYGDINVSDKGKITNTYDVTNFRNMISIAYKF